MRVRIVSLPFIIIWLLNLYMGGALFLKCGIYAFLWLDRLNLFLLWGDALAFNILVMDSFPYQKWFFLIRLSKSLSSILEMWHWCLPLTRPSQPFSIMRRCISIRYYVLHRIRSYQNWFFLMRVITYNSRYGCVFVSFLFPS